MSKIERKGGYMKFKNNPFNIQDIQSLQNLSRHIILASLALAPSASWASLAINQCESHFLRESIQIESGSHKQKPDKQNASSNADSKTETLKEDSKLSIDQKIVQGFVYKVERQNIVESLHALRAVLKGSKLANSTVYRVLDNELQLMLLKGKNPNKGLDALVSAIEVAPISEVMKMKEFFNFETGKDKSAERAKSEPGPALPALSQAIVYDLTEGKHWQIGVVLKMALDVGEDTNRKPQEAFVTLESLGETTLMAENRKLRYSGLIPAPTQESNGTYNFLKEFNSPLSTTNNFAHKFTVEQRDPRAIELAKRIKIKMAIVQSPGPNSPTQSVANQPYVREFSGPSTTAKREALVKAAREQTQKVYQISLKAMLKKLTNFRKNFAGKSIHAIVVNSKTGLGLEFKGILVSIRKNLKSKLTPQPPISRTEPTFSEGDFLDNRFLELELEVKVGDNTVSIPIEKDSSVTLTEEPIVPVVP
jgi:hypothetical protein